MDFLLDSVAEENTINILTWNAIRILYPKLSPTKTSSKLAKAQGSILTSYGKIQLYLVPTQIIEQTKLLIKHFKQTFHITDKKPNLVAVPFITKYILTRNILNS